MTTQILSAVIAVQCFVIILQSIIHHFERKDLYNRIMSRNLADYKSEKLTSVTPAHRRVLDRWRRKDGDR